MSSRLWIKYSLVWLGIIVVKSMFSYYYEIRLHTGGKRGYGESGLLIAQLELNYMGTEFLHRIGAGFSTQIALLSRSY